MKKHSQWSILAIASLVLLILTAACSFPGAQTATPTPTPKPPLTVLKESQKAMNALHSYALNGTYASKTTSTDSGDTDAQMKLSGQESQSPASLSLRIDATVTAGGISIPFSVGMIVVDQKGYIQNAKKNGPWYILSDQQGKDLLGGGIGNLATTTNAKLLDATTVSDLTDHSVETLNGKKLRHITITVTDTKKALKKAFLESTGDFKDLTADQVDNIKLQTGTADYWVDEATMYTYQQTNHYIAQYHADGTSIVAPGTPNVTKDQTMTLMYSSFDVPVGIKAPANAQPLQNIIDVIS